MDIDGILTRKVLGVKAVYIAALIAIILAIVAFNIWRRDQVGGTTDPAEKQPADDAGEDYPTGTFISGNAEVADVSDATASLSNDDWYQRAVNHIVQYNRANAVTAQAAIGKYLDSVDLSFAELNLVNYAIAGVGLPPMPPAIGKVPEAPSSTPTTATPRLGAVATKSLRVAVIKTGGSAKIRVNVATGGKTVKSIVTTSATPLFTELKPKTTYTVTAQSLAADGTPTANVSKPLTVTTKG